MQEAEAAERAHEWQTAIHRVAQRIGAKLHPMVGWPDEVEVELPAGWTMPAFVAEVERVAQAIALRKFATTHI